MTRIAELVVAGASEPWRTLGLEVDAQRRARVGTVGLRFVGSADPPAELVVETGVHAPTTHTSSARGLVCWILRDAPDRSIVSIDGLAVEHVVEAEAVLAGGARASSAFVRIDHVVVATPDLARTVAALEAGLGEPCKRIRTLPTGSGANLHQAFFRVGEVIVEVVGPPAVDPDPLAAGAPATFGGLVLVAADLDAVCARLGPSLVSPARPAVQPGRRIATARHALGLGLPVALMD